MSRGKILVADERSDYLLKFVGDVRLNLCTSLNRYMQALFKKDKVNRVVVDMLDAEGVDSTTLGLIAKMGLYCRKHYQTNVQLFCDNPSILRTLSCMGLDEIIDVLDRELDSQLDSDLGDYLEESSGSDAAVDEIRQHVLEAHRVLSQINPNGGEEFADLISALERDS